MASPSSTPTDLAATDQRAAELSQDLPSQREEVTDTTSQASDETEKAPDQSTTHPHEPQEGCPEEDHGEERPKGSSNPQASDAGQAQPLPRPVPNFWLHSLQM